MKGQLTTGFGHNPISLRDGAAAIFRRRALILFTFLAVVTGTIVVTLLLPNRYDSRMKILVKNQRVDVAITAEATNGINAPTVDNEVSENQINSEIELLTSKDLLMQVVNETGLAKSETDLFGRSAPEAVRVEGAVNRLTKDLSITPVRKANIITVSYSSNSPQLSAAVLKKLGDLYLEKHLKLNHPAGASDFFKEKADEYEAQLKQSEQQLTDFQQSNNLVVLSQQKELTLQKTAEAKANVDKSKMQSTKRDKVTKEEGKEITKQQQKDSKP